MTAKLETVEPFAIPDTFVSGLAEVEDIGGGCLRFIFYCRHTHEGREELQIAARLIMPMEAVPSAMKITARNTHICVCEANRAPTN